MVRWILVRGFISSQLDHTMGCLRSYGSNRKVWLVGKSWKIVWQKVFTRYVFSFWDIIIDKRGARGKKLKINEYERSMFFSFSVEKRFRHQLRQPWLVEYWCSRHLVSAVSALYQLTTHVEVCLRSKVVMEQQQSSFLPSFKLQLEQESIISCFWWW